MPVDLDGDVAQAVLDAGVLGDRAVHLAGDVHAEQPLLLAVLLPLRAQAGEVGRQRLDGADDGGQLDLLAHRLDGVVLRGRRPRSGCRTARGAG